MLVVSAVGALCKDSSELLTLRAMVVYSASGREVSETQEFAGKPTPELKWRPLAPTSLSLLLPSTFHILCDPESSLHCPMLTSLLSFRALIMTDTVSGATIIKCYESVISSNPQNST